MEPKDYGAIAFEALTRAQEALGENATEQEMSRYLVDMDDSDVEALMKYMVAGVHAHLFDNLVNGTMESGMSPGDVINETVSATVPTVLMIARILYQGKPRSKSSNRYMSTIEAEMSLKNMIVEQEDLSEIWPTEYVTEVIGEFSDPATAFLAGVLCGRRDG